MAEKKYNILLTADDKTRSAFDSAGRNLDSMAGSLFNVQSLLAGVSLVSFTAMVKSGIDAADAMNKSAQKIGTTTDALSRLKYAADLSDVSFEQLEKGMTKLSKAAYDAASTGGASEAAFQKLGISVKDSSGALKDSSVLLAEMADKFAVMKDGSAKTALAMTVFGKGQFDMIPLLNEGSAGLDKMAAEADRLGVTISGSTGPEAERFNDNLTRIKAAGEGAANQMTAALLPALNVVAEAFVGGAKDGTLLNMAIGGVKTTFEALVILGSDVAFVFKTIGNSIGGTAAQIAAFASGDFAGVARINKMMLDDAKKSREELDEFQRKILNPPEAAAAVARTGSAPDIENEAANKTTAAMLKRKEDAIAKQNEMDDKYIIEKAKKDWEAGEKQTLDLVTQQQTRFVALRQVAEEADASDLEIALLKQERALADLELQRMIMATDHELSLAELEQFEQAKEDIIRAHAGGIADARVKSESWANNFVNNLRKGDYANAMDIAAKQTAGLAQHSRAIFNINKAASLAKAAVSLPGAVIKSFENGGGYPWGLIPAGLMLAEGLSQISAINSTQFGGGGAGASVGGGGGGGGIPSQTTSPGVPTYPMSPTTEAPKAGTTININLGDDVAFVPVTAVRALFDQFNDLIRDGAKLEGITVS